jgi:predicted nucleotidyltransferase
VEIKNYTDKFAAVFKEELKDNLVGVYLHGSLAMGCFNPERSDVDLLVICENELSTSSRKRIIKTLLTLTQGKPNQLEMSIVLKRYVKEFVYPTPFELHYFHPGYLTDEDFICGGGGFADPDLAGHFTVTYHRGITLLGPEIRDLFAPVDKQFYIESIFNDIQDAPREITGNPVYFTLNLCRVLCYLKEGKVASKREGGEWGILNVPSAYQEIVRQCLDIYNGAADQTSITNDRLLEFSNWMLDECRRLR